MAWLKKTKQIKTEPLKGFWFCPVRRSRITAVVCGKIQTESRRPCERARHGDVCERLDSTEATEAWHEYERSKA